MHKLYSTLILASLVLLLSSGCSSKGMQKLSIQNALADTASNLKFDPNISVKFGDNGGSGKLWTANKKTNTVNKGVAEGCNRAFMSAIIALQDRAKKEGKTSVVDVHSYYKKNKFSSSTQFDCESGAVMAGVALRGRVQ
jgi:hypothetical protein